MIYLKQHKKILLTIIAISLIVVVVLQALAVFLLTDSMSREMIRDTSIRMIIGAVFVITLYYLGFEPFKKNPKSMLWIVMVILPGLIISVNNFPWSAYLSGRAFINEPLHLVYLFAVECLSTGFLEESVFRGIILVVIIQRLPQTKAGILKSIIISSALFGLIHLVNLISGASLGDTLLQIGYSFLMGALWSVVYLASKNLLYPILLHATYNFFGLVLFRLGVVINRFDLITVVITAGFALLASLFYFGVFGKLSQTEIAEMVGTSDGLDHTSQ